MKQPNFPNINERVLDSAIARMTGVAQALLKQTDRGDATEDDHFQTILKLVEESTEELFTKNFPFMEVNAGDQKKVAAISMTIATTNLFEEAGNLFDLKAAEASALETKEVAPNITSSSGAGGVPPSTLTGGNNES